MNQYQLVATVFWGGFQLSIIALIAGLFAQHRHRRGLALTLLFFAVLGTLAFSFAGGFSIGRLTVAIPVLVIGYVVGMDRGPAAVTIPAAEPAGLLVGVMLIGQHFADDRLLSLAAAYERHTAGFQIEPNRPTRPRPIAPGRTIRDAKAVDGPARAA